MSTKEERRRYQAYKRKERKALGLCVTCGQRSPRYFYKQCDVCRTKFALAAAIKVCDSRIDKEESYYSHGWLTIDEAAERYGWHRGTVRKWVNEGRIKKRGFAYRHTWIANTDIERYSEVVRRRILERRVA